MKSKQKKKLEHKLKVKEKKYGLPQNSGSDTLSFKQEVLLRQNFRRD